MDWITKEVSIDWLGLLDYSHILIVVAYIIGGIIIHWLIKRILRIVGKKYNPTALHWVFLDNISKILIIAIVVYASLNIIPQLNSVSTFLLTSSSILVAAVGLASQKVLSNAVCGVFISLSRPFAVGDRIKLMNQNVTGFVESVNLIHTIIKTIENNRLLVPNALVLDDVIENLNYIDTRLCHFMDVGITFESDIGLAQSIIAETVMKHPLWIDTRTDEDMENDVPAIRVMVREISNHRVELRTGVWTQSVMNNFILCSDARKEIVEQFIKNNIVLYRPIDTITCHLEN